MNPEPYRHSGQAPPSGLMLAMVVTIICSLALGVAYAFAVSWIPIVQASVLATGALGAGNLPEMLVHPARSARAKPLPKTWDIREFVISGEG